MRNIVSKCILAAIALTFAVCSCGVAFAGDYIIWWGLQKRTYEGKEPVYRINIYVNDTSWNAILADVIDSVSLMGPGGTVPVPELTFSITETLEGSFDSKSGKWSYDKDFTSYSSYVGYFDAPYAFGEYTLTVVDKDGITHKDTKSFYQQYDLPQISSSSFRGEETASGDFILRWDPIMDPEFWESGPDSAIRAWVWAKNGEDYTADSLVTLPSNSAMLYVPKAVMDKLRGKGDTLGVALHIKVNDGTKHHRYYTTFVPLNDLKGTADISQPKFIVVPVPVEVSE